MGYRGKLDEQEKARLLRADGATLADIASTLGVAKSSVSRWVRDVPFTPSPRRTGGRRRPNRLHDAKLAQIAALDAAGVARLGQLSEQAFLAAGVALYAGCATSFRSTSRGCESGCTFTRDWILTQRMHVGRQPPTCRSSSSASRTDQWPTLEFGTTSTNGGARTWSTPARRPIAR